MADTSTEQAITTRAGSGAPGRSPVEGAAGAQEEAQKAFSASVLISAVRCTLTYVLFPFALPALGIAAGVGSGIGIVASVLGIGANVFSIKRFHGSGHRWRWHITAINVGIIVLLSVLLVLDFSDLA